MVTKIILLIAVNVLIITIFSRIAMWLEKAEFNDGKCACCGLKLTLVDDDIGNGICFECKNCGNIVWISNPSVYKKYLEENEHD